MGLGKNFKTFALGHRGTLRREILILQHTAGIAALTFTRIPENLAKAAINWVPVTVESLMAIGLQCLGNNVLQWRALSNCRSNTGGSGSLCRFRGDGNASFSGGDAPCLVAGEEVRRRSPGFLLEIDRKDR